MIKSKLTNRQEKIILSMMENRKYYLLQEVKKIDLVINKQKRRTY